ncbi:hypothetical protein GJ496_000497 [Pomphorhynchus laevis]|nr:hypothetical protein GJ496_000497 [Pomphorhynchus laevis]
MYSKWCFLYLPLFIQKITTGLFVVLFYTVLILAIQDDLNIELIYQQCVQRGGYFNAFDLTCSKTLDSLARKSQLKDMCKSISLEYSAAIDFCVQPLTKSERETHFTPIINKTMDFDLKHRTCFRAGMLYSTQFQQCVHFPDQMDDHMLKYSKRYQTIFINEYYTKFCQIAGLRYNVYYGFCVSNVTDAKEFLRPFHDTYLFENRDTRNKHLCFLEGLQLVGTKRAPQCAPFPVQHPKIKDIRELYMKNREDFIIKRCPSYLQYHRQMGFCTRRPPIVYSNMFDMRRVFRIAKIALYKSKRYKHITNDFSQDDIAKCCINSGLDYSKLKSKCVRYLANPTAHELVNYRFKYQDIKNATFKKYCNLIGKTFNQFQGLCI